MGYKNENDTQLSLDLYRDTVMSAAIDSLNLTSKSFISLFFYKEGFKIEYLKRKGLFNNKRHMELFATFMCNNVKGKKLCPFIEIAAIHKKGVYFRLTVHARSRTQPLCTKST